MLRSFILITFRILWRNKVTSFVNIFSLSVGITAFIFIMLYVQHETSYDKFHVNYDRVYRLEADDWGKLPPIFGTHLKANVPEIEDVALISCQQMWAYSIRDPQSKEVECDITLADSTTFDVFSFQLVRGNIHTALKEPGSLVISESVAKKMFGDDDPMGKTVFAGIDQLQITGVLKDVNLSHFEFDALMSASSFKKFLPDRDMNNTTASNWAWSATYLLLNKNVDPKTLETKLNEELASINDGILVDT
ncbi:MAG TPA: ABC transporter permease, partial [Cyclobacteriaceae bacterium]|nr:ABC transporter permease [Cyclobacteriaceae bacterium]